MFVFAALPARALFGLRAGDVAAMGAANAPPNMIGEKAAGTIKATVDPSMASPAAKL